MINDYQWIKSIIKLSTLGLIIIINLHRGDLKFTLAELFLTGGASHATGILYQEVSQVFGSIGSGIKFFEMLE